jgi:hypothetical protein
MDCFAEDVLALWAVGFGSLQNGFAVVIANGEAGAVLEEQR